MNEKQKQAITRAREHLEVLRARTGTEDPAVTRGRYDYELATLLRELGEDVPELHERSQP